MARSGNSPQRHDANQSSIAHRRDDRAPTYRLRQNSPQNTGSSERFGFGLTHPGPLYQNRAIQNDYGIHRSDHPKPFDDWLRPHFSSLHDIGAAFGASSNRVLRAAKAAAVVIRFKITFTTGFVP